MAEPTHYIAAKIASAIGGLFGGFGMMTFIEPRSISEAFARGGISTGAAIIFAGPTLTMLGFSQDWEMQMMSGAVMGFLSYSVLGAVARFFVKNEEKDIFELASEAKAKSKAPVKRRRKK